MSAAADAGDQAEGKEMMSPNKLIVAGGTGSVITAICCFTPVLVVALGAVGLSAWLSWIDYVLFPMLAAFIGLTAYGFWRRQRVAASCLPPACCPPPAGNRERS